MPPEVLTSCATFVSDTDPRPIVTLTHVCRYWRKSIVSNPRSWTSITTGWKRLGPLCLERAGAVPLAVDITVSDIGGGEDFLESLIPQTSKIGRLRLTGYSSVETVVDDLPGFFDSPMPNLTSLDLQQTTEPAELFPSNEAPVPPIFQDVTKLESLSLTQTPLYPVLLSVTSLRELKLLGYTSPFHFGTFLGFLGSNPDLERVVLDIQFVADSVEIAPTRMTPLPHLRHLSTTCARAIDAKGLLSCISLPHGTCLEVSCSQKTTLDLLLPSPPTSIQTMLAPITIAKFQVTPWEFRVLGSNGFLSFRYPKTETWGGGFDLFLTASIREFHMDITPWTFSFDGLGFLLAHLPALETLAFANATWATKAFDSLAGQPPRCPCLKTVVFFNCKLTPGALKEFEGVVVKRKDLATAWLYRVVIVGNPSTLPDYTVVQQLRQHVPCVDVRMDDKLPDLS